MHQEMLFIELYRSYPLLFWERNKIHKQYLCYSLTFELLLQRLMSQISIVQNAFDSSSTTYLMKLLKMINFNQPRDKISEQLDELSSDSYLWAIGYSPAYFVQYQVKSAAIFKVKDHILIAWKPKFIEYPSMIVFPQIGDKTITSMKTEVDENSTTTEYTTSKMVEYLQKFYGTHFYSDSNFETNLVTFSKHFVSKISKHSYWHALLQDTNKLYVTQLKKADSILKIRIFGLKQGYDKTLLLFSFKGKRENLFSSVKNKWMQIISFLAMIVIFVSVVACPSDGTGEGLCEYRSQMTLGGAGVMLSLIGLRYGQKNKNKKTEKKKVGKYQ